jgi:FMN phosphatase YigB (HAD superfamily)
MIKRAIFLDFDGVLFDTVKEVYCVSMIAFGRATTISDVAFGTQHFHLFNQFRFLIGSAWNYYFLMGIIDEKVKNPELDVREMFLSDLENHNRDEYGFFEENFFRTRKHLKETDYKDWIFLSHPYPIVADIRMLLKNHQESIYFITTRDRESVVHLLKAYEVEFVEDQVFSKEDLGHKKSKKDLIKEIIRKNDVSESLFVDDLKSNLVACENMENLILLQACWGYVPPEERKDNKGQILRGLKNFIQEDNVGA